MSNFLRRNFRFFVLLALSSLFAYEASAQVGCNGFDGAPQPSGGVNSINNGTLCLNAPSPVPAEIEIVASNVADGNNPNNFAVIINWDDGSPEQVIAFGGAITVQNTGPHAYRIPSIIHQFLPRACGGPNGRQCAYKPRVYLRIAGIRCSAEFGNPPDFFRFNTDNECSGRMRLSENATNATVYEVCAGAETTVTFRDRTILNCLPPQEVTGLNSTKRWRRFVYGTFNSIDGAVRINGVAQTFPFGAAVAPTVSSDGLNSSGPPFASNSTQSITIPATADPGQEFHIRLQYWNFCNQFTTGAAPVFFDAVIRVVSQPAAPTPVNGVACNGENLSTYNFRIEPVTSSAILWYADNAGAPGAAIVNPNGTNNRSLPASAFPSTINPATAGVYRVWASYRASATASGLLCESIKVPVTLTIREPLNNPGPVSGTQNICNGTANEPYNVPVAAASMPIGGATFYEWEVVDASNAVVTDVTLSAQADGRTVHANFNVANGTFGASPSVVRKIRMRRRYTTDVNFPGASRCSSSRPEISITVFRNTDDGSVSGGGTFCEGEDLGDIVWTPGVGSIQRWEVSTGGPFSTIAAFGTNTTVDPTTLALPAGTHTIRAIIQNGVCASDPTDNVIFTILANPAIANAGPNQNLCIPVGALTATMAANAPGVGVTSTWTVEAGPGTAAFLPDTSDPNASVTVTQPGTYTFRWTLNNGLCNSVSDVLITFGRNAALPAPAGNDVCGLVANLTSSAPTNGEAILWTGPVGVTFGTASASNTTVTVPAVGTYTFNLQYTTACGSQDQNISVDFGEGLTVTPELDKTICVDDAALPAISINATVTGGTFGGGTGQSHWIRTGPASGTFGSSGTGTGGNLSNANVADTYTPSLADYAAGTVVLELVADGNLCSDVSNTLTLTLDKLPDAADVGADFSVCGDVATLAALPATEDGVGSWSVITAGPAIADPADPVSQVTDLQAGANQFQWTVNSEFGICSSTNAVLTISREAPPTVNDISPSDLCESSPNSSTQTGVDLAATYDNAITGGAGGVIVEWYTDAARTVPVVDVNNEDVVSGTVYYTRVSTTGTPVCSTDGVATFTVNSKPFVANLSPTFCEDLTGSGLASNINLVSFENDVELNVPNRSTAWFSDAALTTAIPTPADVDNVANAVTFYAEVSNTVTGCANVAEVEFIINPKPTGNPIDGPATICYDANDVHFYQVDTFKPNHTYQWTIPGSVTNTTGTTDDFFVTLQFPTSGDDFEIKVIEISGEGCQGPEETILVDVEDQFIPLTITPGKIPICEGEENITFTTQSVADYTYLWSVPAGSTIISGQGSNEITVNMGSVNGNVMVTPNKSVCTGDGATLPVTITPRPVLFIDPTGHIVCSQDAIDVVLSVAAGSEPATSYKVTARVEAAGLTTAVPAVPPTISGDANLIRNDVFRNLTGGILNVNYTVIPVSAVGCDGTPRIVPVSIRPEPQLDPGLGKELCSDEVVNVLLRTAPGKGSADNYLITAIDQNGATRTAGTSTPGATVLQDGIMADAWNNVTSNAVIVAYHITPQDVIDASTTCIGENVAVNFTIHPEPVLAATPPSPVVCSQTPTDIDLTVTNGVLANFSWTIDAVGPNIQGAFAGSSGPPSAKIINILTNSSNTVADDVTYRVIAENVVSAQRSCFSNPLSLTITVNPLPQVNPSVSLDECPNDPNDPTVHNNTILTDLNNSISTSGTIKWYAADPSNGGVPEIATPASYQIQHGITIYAEVNSGTFSEEVGNPPVLRACRKIVPITPVVFAPVTANVNSVDESCAENNDGEIILNVTSGTPQFSAQLGTDPPIVSNGTFSFKNLAAGILYDIVVTDKNGCEFVADDIVVNEPATLLVIQSAHSNVSCFFDAGNVLNSNGRIEILATGGPSDPDPNDGVPGQYTFEILPPVTAPNATGVFANLRPGNYTIEVTDNLGGCVKQVTSIDITVPPPIEVAPLDVLPLSCFGSNDGSIGVTATGGNGNFTYRLVQSGATQNHAAGVTASFTGLAPAIYQISIEDANGCRAPMASAIIPSVTDLNPGIVGTDQDLCPEKNAEPFTELAEPFGASGTYEILWQFSTVGGNTPVGTPLENDPNWPAVPGGTTNVIDPNATLIRDPNNPAPMYYRRLVRSVPSRANPAASCLTYKFDRVITINNLPTPNIQMFGTGADGVICEGQDEFIFLEMAVGQGTPPMTFEVFDGDILSFGTGGQRSGNYKIQNGNLAPIVGFTKIKDAFGCAAPDQLVQISFAPKPSFNINGADKCAGQAFEFTHAVDPGVDYTWSFGDGTTQSYNSAAAQLPIIKTFAAGSTSVETKYTVRLTVFNGPCPSHFDEEIVTIYPTISRNIIEPQDKICEGETINFTDNTEGVSSANWKLVYMDNGTPVEQNFLFPVGGNVPFTLLNPTNQNPLEYSIEYTATNSFNCTSTELLGPIFVYQKPDAQFTNSPLQPQMVGGLVDQTYTIQNFEASFFDYSWSDVGQEIITDQTNAAGDVRSVQYGEDKPIDVTLFVVNSLFSQCSDSERKIITIDPTNPSIGFTATPLAGCFPITVTTDNISATYDRFEWTLFSTNGTNEVTTLREPQFRLTQPGVYTLSMVATKSGSSLPPAVATPKTITVLDRPIADFMLRTKQVYIGQAVEPINTSYNADTYLWDFDDGTTSEEFQPRHFYQLEGKDSIMLISSKNHGPFDIDGDGIDDGLVFCRDTTKQSIHIIAGGALKIPNAFTPNVSGPNSGHEDLNFTNDVFLPIMEGVEEFTMQIFDRWGTLVFETRDKTIGWNGYDRNGRLMPAGVYVYKLVMRLGDGQRTTQVGDVTLIR